MEFQRLLGSSDQNENSPEPSTTQRRQKSSKSLKLRKLFAEDYINHLYFDEARAGKAVNAAVKYAGNLNNLIPTGTFMFFQFFLPIVSNGGRCADPGHVSSTLTAFLLATCTIWCFLLSFTDTVKWTDGTVHHGIAMPRGIWLPGVRGVAPESLPQYRLKPIDFVHASVGAGVFVTSALFTPTVFRCVLGDSATFVSKFVPDSLVQSVPLLVGFLASFVCFMWPSNRRSIDQPLVEKIADDLD